MLRHVLVLIVGLLFQGVSTHARAEEPLPAGAILRLGDARFLAGGAVARLEFSADGRQLAAWTGAVRSRTEWDTVTWEPFHTRDDILQAGAVVRFTPTNIPDSTKGVVIDRDGVAVVRDFRTGKDVVRLTGHHVRVTAVAVSPDGKRIATGSGDGLVRVWDAQTFRPLTTPRGHLAAVTHVEVSADGRHVLTASRDGSARLWDLASGRELRAFPLGDGLATFTADGSGIRLREGERLRTRDVVTGLEIVTRVAAASEPLAIPRRLLSYTGLAAVVAPDGRSAIIGCSDGRIRMIEIASGQTRRRFEHPGGCFDLTLTADGRRLLSAGGDHSVLIWGLRVQDVPLSPELKRETSASKLWDWLDSADAEVAYLAMARLAADPPATVRIARLRLNAWADADTLVTVRAIELLEALGTADARDLLREIATSPANTLRSREANSALKRMARGNF